MGSNSRLNDALKNSMMQEFEINNLGLIHYFIGLEVDQDDSQIFITQTKYANDLLHKFDMDDYAIVILLFCCCQNKRHRSADPVVSPILRHLI